MDQVVAKEKLMEEGLKRGEELAPLGMKRDAYYGIKKGLWGS